MPLAALNPPRLQPRLKPPSDFEVTLTPVLDAEFPWGLAFLPNGDLLFSEKENGLKYVTGGQGTATPVAGIPPAMTEGQGGYFGLVLDPDFENNRLIYARLCARHTDRQWHA